MNKYTREEVIKFNQDYFNDDLAADVTVNKYLLRDNDKNFLERDPNDSFDRIAKELSRIENNYINPTSYDDIRFLINDFKYIIVQGSPFSAIGNNYQIQSISNCFTIDSPFDSYGGILKTDQELCQIAKRRGGIGFDISTIRPKGAMTQNAAKTTDGIAVFMERYSNSCREVAQNGRRGALMLTISINHPEIETFINIKKDLSKVTGANISIRITDEFMNAVISDSDFELKWPIHSINPKFTKTVKAKDIWDQLIDAAWTSAEPGVLFWDTILKNGPADIYEFFRSVSTNPSLRKGTMILTKSGPVPIEDLEDLDFEVYNLKNSYSKAKCRLSGKNQQLYEVKLSTGFSYFATKEHRWATNSGEKTTLELKPKDRLPIQKKTNIYNGSLGDIDDGFLIGWFLGDGWKTIRKDNGKNQYGFIVSENDALNGIKDKLLKILQNKVQFSGNWIERQKESKIWYEINTVNKSLDDFMNKFFNPCKNSGLNKKLISMASEDFIKGLIDGYFSSDGSIDNKTNKITFVSKNLKLISDISEVLGFYGIRTNLRKSKTHNSSFPNKKIYNKIYTRNDLYICDLKSLEHFKSLFNISSAEKQAKLNNLKHNKNIVKRDYVSIKEIIKTDLFEDVWDISVYDNDNCFSLSHCITHNCSELTLSPYDSCRLMILNLFSFVLNPFTNESRFDWELFKKYTRLAQRLMDDMVDLEIEAIDKILNKIKNDPEPDDVKELEVNLWTKIRLAAQRGRRTGLGQTGLGDTLAALGIKYGSDESIQMTEKIYKCLAQNAHTESINLAKERGSFPEFNYELEKDHEYLNRVIPKESHDDWKKYGRRNISLTTTAPVGSLSLLAKTTSGIEPVYMVSSKRRRKNMSEGDRVDFIDHLGDKWQEYEVFHEGYKQWKELNPDSYEYLSPYYKATAMDIDWIKSVEIQSVAQKWVDHAISKTCNLPNSATKELVSEIYMTAWKSGCKGFTVYRDGCRTGVILSSDSKKEDEFKQNNAAKRPDLLNCDINHVSVNGEKWIVLIGKLDDKPYEIFGGKADKIQFPSRYKNGKIEKDKGKSKYNLIIQDEDDEFIVKDILSTFDNAEYAVHTRLLSLSMRHGAPIKYIVDQLQKDKQSTMFDFSKVIARVLKKYITDGESGQKCETCKSKLTFEEGCLSCKNCGTSKC